MVAPPAPPPPTEPSNRIGIDGTTAVGPVMSAGGELRAEFALAGRHALTLRAEWLKAQYIFNEEEEGGPSPAWNLFGGYVGDRAYWGTFYLDLAIGVAYLQRDDFVDDVGDRRISHSSVLPGARLGLGGKIDGRLDLGLELMFPAVGLGVHVGLDFLHW
ncbi:MAG: hypothetical protein ACKV2T_19310 [Kofleriaceae bacterium]